MAVSSLVMSASTAKLAVSAASFSTGKAVQPTAVRQQQQRVAPAGGRRSLVVRAEGMRTETETIHSDDKLFRVSGENGVNAMVALAKQQISYVDERLPESIARMNYPTISEQLVNEQINIFYNVQYIAHSLYAYFNRDNVALYGLAKYYKQLSDRERGRAEMLMSYQNERGGRVKLQNIVKPDLDLNQEQGNKGDALYALELTLALHKMVNEKLLYAVEVGTEQKDAEMEDFFKSNFLHQQVQYIKQLAHYISQLRRVGPGHGTWHWDQELNESLE
eukprot:jgi/Chlat1/1090/Chrsp110S01579